MKFAWLPTEEVWAEWDQDNMRLYFFPHGVQRIDENSALWTLAEIHEFESWHDLYLHTGFNPLAATAQDRYVWLDPDGEFWQGEAHACVAEDIALLVFGEELDIDYADDFLIQRGWVKLSATMMHYIYCESDMYDNITTYQWKSICEWCEYWDLPQSDFVKGYDNYVE